MPKIAAPTLAEHRDLRRTSLLTAGRELAAAGGPKAVTMAAVAARTGLSRPAVYEYFASSDELLAAVVLDEMREWADEIVAALAVERTADAKVHRYVTISLDIIANGRHAVLEGLISADIPEPCRREFGRLHASMAAPLKDALEELGVIDTSSGLRYLQGVTEAASRRITPGDPADEVEAEAERAYRFVLAGLNSLTSTS